jgi:hypothetical protein
MFPTSTLPVVPFSGPAGIGTLVGVLAIGVLVALLVGLVLHRREQPETPAIAVPEADAPAPEKAARTRLSA